MKSRIPKEYFEQSDSRVVEYDEPVQTPVQKSTMSGSVISSEETKLVRKILHRHRNQIKDDIFGRSDVFGGLMYSRLEKRAWPELPNAAVVSDTISMCDRYKHYSDTLIKEYMDTMIKHKIFLSPKILDTLPVIDMTGMFPTKRIKEDPSGQVRMEFNEQDMHVIREYGWKVLMPYFDEQVIRANQNRYIYVKLNECDKHLRKLSIHTETYIGDEKVWLCSNKADITYTFGQPTVNEQAPCRIEVVNGDDFEHMLSRGIKNAKWDKRTRTMWCDTFDCAETASDITLVQLKDNRKEKLDGEMPTAYVFTNNKRELSVLKKAFGPCCVPLVNQDFKSHYDGMIRRTIVPEYLNDMVALFIAMQAEPEIIKEDDTFVQIYGGLVITSEEKVKKRG